MTARLTSLRLNRASSIASSHGKKSAPTEGTGIVHIAPGCGKEDFELGKEFGLKPIAPIDESGIFVEGFGPFTGQYASNVAKPIIRSLKEKNLLYRTEEYKHSYPICWRCKTQLLFRLVDEWYINMDELRHQIIEVTKQTRWIPEIGQQLEIEWLTNMHDWMISKKRYWGLALPIYHCQSCGNVRRHRQPRRVARARGRRMGRV